MLEDADTDLAIGVLSGMQDVEIYTGTDADGNKPVWPTRAKQVPDQ
jgi:hypothetical protein